MTQTDYRELELGAHALFAKGDFSQAHTLFKKVANHYKATGNHKQAALCFVSAASCWGIKSGEKTFYESAVQYEKAAQEAQKYADFEYAAMLYKYAAMNYERDGEFLNFSQCFYNGKESYRKFLLYSILGIKTTGHGARSKEKRNIFSVVRKIMVWCLSTASWAVWGHGERPSRALFSGVGTIVVAAVLYMYGALAQNGQIFQPHFLESLYFSIVTFTTLGYGDITPVGFARAVATIEAFGGMCMVPLFIVSLSRRYLRM